MSNLNLQKLREWVWLWPWTFKYRWQSIFVTIMTYCIARSEVTFVDTVNVNTNKNYKMVFSAEIVF